MKKLKGSYFLGIFLLEQKGLSLLTAIMALLILAALGLAIVSVVNIDSEVIVNLTNSSQSLFIAEAGIEKGIRAVIDDTKASAQTVDPSGNGYYGAPSIDPFNVVGNSVDMDGALRYGGKTCTIQSLQTIKSGFNRA